MKNVHDLQFRVKSERDQNEETQFWNERSPIHPSPQHAAIGQKEGGLPTPKQPATVFLCYPKTSAKQMS